jgi:hypothetical protein
MGDERMYHEETSGDDACHSQRAACSQLPAPGMLISASVLGTIPLERFFS